MERILARIEVVDKLLELGELKGKTNGDRMNSFMNCAEENYKKKVNRCKKVQNPNSELASNTEDDANNENSAKDQYRKVPNRCSKKFDDFTNEFYDDGKDDYVSEKRREDDEENEEINTRKAMTLAMFIKPKNRMTASGKEMPNDSAGSEQFEDQEGHYIIIEKPEEILEIMSAIDATQEDFDITYALDNGEEEFEIANPIKEDFEIADAIEVKSEKFVMTSSGDIPVEEFEFTDERDAEDVSDVEIEVEDSFIYLLYGSAWPSL